METKDWQTRHVAGRWSPGLVTSSALLLLIGISVANADSHSTGFDFSGFGTLAVTQTDTDEAEFRSDAAQFEGASDDLDLGLRSKLGIQASWAFNDELSVTTQLLARTRGSDSLDPDIEWLFASYRPTEWLDLRAGRMVVPAFIYSDYRHVGYAQLQVEPPAGMYINQSTQAFEGVQMINQVSVGDGVLGAQLSLGETENELLLIPPPITIQLDNLRDLNISYAWNDLLFRVSHFQADYDVPDSFVAPDFEDNFTGFGFQYDNGELLVQYERAERELSPDIGRDTISQYVLVGYRFNKWSPSLAIVDRETMAGGDAGINIFAVRYDAFKNVAFKLQWEEADAAFADFWLPSIPPPVFFATGEVHNIYTFSMDFVF